ncbi:NAD-dependent epimerase/dehydratase family protein [Terrilactibacillus sp. BCM23-1]|uniref:NAD-dependent epimerase/dehydratase family protein n=1 Tax=Terrilactibacillus tamarindi TaxID=2599694 RepID=A0A6N8CPT0_9BACI|nr:NAD(P)-dependent oxidoreductase [Terrilactibacillus tamarindi]MTT30905.1 NAD-dependent epimerase/dehydratase family protein [Terrilactibacillus tamarindi]
MNRQTVIITGVGGFLGYHLANYLDNLGYNVIGVGRIKMRTINEVYNVSLPDQKLVDILKIAQPDVVIHCAGSSSVPDSIIEPYYDFQKNVDVCGFILESIRKYSRSCQFIYLSSAAVYGNPASIPIKESDRCQPISPYGYHKLMCEMLIKEYQEIYNLQSTIFRIFSAYGEGLKKQVVYDLCQKLTSQDKVIEVYGNGSESRDFIHVSDICRAIELVIKKEITGTFNLATSEEVSISTLVTLLKTYLRSSADIQYIGKTRKGDPSQWKADTTKLKDYGFKPRMTLEQGLKKYCKWYLGGTHI